MGGSCVAGVSEEGEWVRPLGTGNGGAVLFSEQTLDSGSQPVLLDRIVVPLVDAVPDQYQPENWTIGQAQWRHAGHLSDEHAREFLNGLRSPDSEIFRNRTDRISQADLDADPANESLIVIRPTKFRLYYRRNWWNGGRRLRAEFFQAGQYYDLGMTDPAFKDLVGDHPDDERIRPKSMFPSTSFFLCISLGEPYNGDCYKMVAGVVAVPS
jgi:putative nucleic acid modification protein with dual OB domain